MKKFFQKTIAIMCVGIALAASFATLFSIVYSITTLEEYLGIYGCDLWHGIAHVILLLTVILDISCWVAINVSTFFHNIGAYRAIQEGWIEEKMPYHWHPVSMIGLIYKSIKYAK